MNEQMRLLEDTLIEVLNSYNLVPIEAKRLIIKDIYFMTEQKANEIIIEERRQNAEELQPNQLGELSE